jgi:hypothetical protein
MYPPKTANTYNLSSPLKGSRANKWPANAGGAPAQSIRLTELAMANLARHQRLQNWIISTNACALCAAHRPGFNAAIAAMYTNMRAELPSWAAAAIASRSTARENDKH